MAGMIPMHMAKDLAEQHATDLRRMGSAGRRGLSFGRAARAVRRQWQDHRHDRRFLDDSLRLRHRTLMWRSRRRLTAAEGDPCPG
jgi:hypothetical protein